MKRLKIGNKFEASSIALGVMRMAGLSVDEAEKVVLSAVENGIDFVDHADIYGGGKSEEVFAGVLKRNPGLREKLIIQDKVGICKGYYDASREHIIEAAEGCLRRLGRSSAAAAERCLNFAGCCTDEKGGQALATSLFLSEAMQATVAVASLAAEQRLQ